jgi:two-component system sensor histidine kinase UhpB
MQDSTTRPKQSLRLQINLRILLASFVILVLGGSAVIWLARNAVANEMASSLNLAAQLIKLNAPVGNPAHTAVDLNLWLPRFVSMEQTRHLKIQLKKADGEVVNFSASKPPLRTDLPPQWFVKLVATEHIAVSQELETATGQPMTLVVEADPLDEISEAWGESGVFFLSLLVLVIFTMLAVNLVSNKAFKSIALILDGLKAIEQGDYHHALPEFETQEYDAIAKAIRHMTLVLADTQSENRALALNSLQIQEEERQHLAQELHDELGQSLTAIKVMAVTVKKHSPDTAATAETIISVSDHLITVVRSMMRQLHPLVLTELGLTATLKDLTDHWATRHPALAIRLDCDPEADALEQKTSIQIFRIVQECVTNIVRHAQATQTTIKLEQLNDKLWHLHISDNGLGCTQESLKQGFGLLGMRERIHSLGGTLTIQTQPGQGMDIDARIPLP